MLDQTVPLNVRCQMMLNWMVKLERGIIMLWLINDKPENKLKKSLSIKKGFTSIISSYALNNAI